MERAVLLKPRPTPGEKGDQIWVREYLTSETTRDIDVTASLRDGTTRILKTRTTSNIRAFLLAVNTIRQDTPELSNAIVSLSIA